MCNRILIFNSIRVIDSMDYRSEIFYNFNKMYVSYPTLPFPIHEQIDPSDAQLCLLFLLRSPHCRQRVDSLAGSSTAKTRRRPLLPGGVHLYIMAPGRSRLLPLLLTLTQLVKNLSPVDVKLLPEISCTRRSWP